MTAAKPSPVYVARAISDALEQRAIADHWYLDEWSKLDWAHVPIEHIRAVMDTDVTRSGPLDLVRAWNGRGQIVVCGPPGNGKTFAAAVFVLETIRAGGDACWVSAANWALLDLDQQRALLRKATSKGVTVWDDIGAGVTTGQGFHARFEGVTMDRAARPSIVASNANASEMKRYLGAALLDRNTQHGEFHHIEGASLRAADDDPRPCRACDGACKFSARWHAARALVGYLGVEEVETMGREVRRAKVVVDGEEIDGEADYLADTGPELRLQVGHKLDRAAWAELKFVRERYGLDRATILAAAVELETSSPTAKAEADYSAAMLRLAEKRRADTEQLAAESSKFMQGLLNRRVAGPCASTTRLDDTAPHAAYAGKEGEKKLRALGYRVRASAGGFIVRKVKWDPSAKKRAAAKGGEIVLEGEGCESDGWDATRRMVAM